MTTPAARPVPPAEHDHELIYRKARDVMLSGSARGTHLPNGDTIEAEAALVLTLSADETVVMEGSYRRLLKWLEYARDRLLVSAPVLEHVREVPAGQAVVMEGLRCPHCGVITWDGDTAGIRVVDYGERWSSFGYLAGNRTVFGVYASGTEMETDRYECEACERPVTLPADVEEDAR